MPLDKISLNNGSNVIGGAPDQAVFQVSSLDLQPAVKDFGRVQAGYARPHAQTFTITNLSSADITDYAVTVSAAAGGAAYDLVTTPGVIAKNGGTAVFTVQPKAGLAKGVYDASLTIAATPAQIRTAGLTFTVTSPSAPGNSSGGGAAAYDITPEKAVNGSIYVDANSASAGRTVTVTVKPDRDCVLDKLTVTDSRGGEIKLSKQEDNRYTFKMPASRVTIRAIFVQTGETPASLPFTDVPETSWYHAAVKYVYENGLMNGASATAFTPRAAASRGMITTILWRLAGSPAAMRGAAFSDVSALSADAYYAGAVAWAAEQGIVSGYDSHTFGPNDPVTREQLAAVLHRFAGFMGYDTAASGSLDRFSDRGNAGAWAVDPLVWAADKGILSGKGEGLLDPKGTASRAETAAMLMRFCQSIAK